MRCCEGASRVGCSFIGRLSAKNGRMRRLGIKNARIASGVGKASAFAAWVAGPPYKAPARREGIGGAA